MNLKSICMKCLWVITAVFLVPLGIFTYSGNIDRFSSAATLSADLFTGKSATEATAYSDEPTLPAGREISHSEIPDMDMAPDEIEREVESSEIPSPLTVVDVSDKLPYPDNLTSHDGVIQKFTYGYYDDDSYFDLDNGGQVRNCTDMSNEELYSLSGRDTAFEIDKNSDEPQILIYHTHATESFERTDTDWYDASFSCKTTERDMNIISVGDKICEQLDLAGIPYIHDTLVHDYPSYDSAYASSRAAVEEILEEYPSIKICLDIHRDGIEREDGTRIAPVTEIDGREAAQLMIISCCDDGSGNIPNFRDNFAFATKLQSALESDWQGITRPLLFDERFYNQDLTTGSLLIEVGSHGNSIEQVQYTGELIGKTLAEFFTE